MPSPAAGGSAGPTDDDDDQVDESQLPRRERWARARKRVGGLAPKAVPSVAMGVSALNVALRNVFDLDLRTVPVSAVRTLPSGEPIDYETSAFVALSVAGAESLCQSEASEWTAHPAYPAITTALGIALGIGAVLMKRFGVSLAPSAEGVDTQEAPPASAAA